MLREFGIAFIVCLVVGVFYTLKKYVRIVK